MFKLNVNASEKKRLLIYAEQSSVNESHWGDGELVLGEETNIFEQCRKESPLDLTMTQFRIVFDWFNGTTQRGAYLLGEDIAILDKMTEAVEVHCRESGIQYWFDPQDPATRIGFIQSVLFPQKGEPAAAQAMKPGPTNNTALDEKIRKAAQGTREDNEFRKNMVEKFKSEKSGIKQADEFLKNLLKKTKGKGL